MPKSRITRFACRKEFLLSSVFLLATGACASPGSQSANADNPDAKPVQTEGKHRHGSSVTGIRSLDLYGDGDSVHLLLGDYSVEGGKIPALRYMRSNDGDSWSEPVLIHPGKNAPSEPFRGVDAQIAGSGDRVAAVWTGQGSSKHGQVSMAVV